MDGLTAEEAALFEVKAVAGGSDFERLLHDFTVEMRAQFDLFRRLRESAEALMAGTGDGTDEAAAKLARADVKAATDAIALIVRTLEKIDALLRQLARDRAEAEDRRLEDSDPATLRLQVAALIAARVEAEVGERLEAAVAARLAEAADSREGRGPP